MSTLFSNKVAKNFVCIKSRTVQEKLRCLRCLLILRNQVCLSEHSLLLLSFKNDTSHSNFFQGTLAWCFKAWCAEVIGDEDSAGIFLVNVSCRKKIVLHRIVIAFPGECP